MRCAMLHQLWRNGAHRLRHRDLELNKEARLSGPTRSVRGLVREPTGERGRGEASTMAGRMGGRGTQSALLELNMLMSACSQRRTGHVACGRPRARWRTRRAWAQRRRSGASGWLGRARDGGRERGCVVWPVSATVQTASYSVQMRENERKQICSSQADQHTRKLYTTRPSSLLVSHRHPCLWVSCVSWGFGGGFGAVLSARMPLSLHPGCAASSKLPPQGHLHGLLGLVSLDRAYRLLCVYIHTCNGLE